MECSGESFLALAASAMNQPRSRPLGSGSQAPVKRQRWSQISIQVWLPRLSCQLGTPTSRAGTHTARQASLKTIDSPVQDAVPWSIDSLGLKLGGFLCAAYFNFNFGNSSVLSF